jgi:hypothetical protein
LAEGKQIVGVLDAGIWKDLGHGDDFGVLLGYKR